MCSRFYLIIFGLIATACLSAQAPTTYANTWRWSILKCEVSTKSDSAFLVDTEKKIWKQYTTGEFSIYMGAFGGAGYNVRMTKAEADNRFSDTSISKIRFTRYWELATLWNTSADSFLVISFEPHCGARSLGSLETFCWAHIPVFYYEKYLEQSEMQRLHDLTLSECAQSFNARLSDDTMYRVVHFLSDSNEYLAQAPYRYLGKMMENAIFSGQLHGYAEKTLGKPLSKGQLDARFVRWDSINAIEDPSQPGTLILAPIRTQEYPTGVVVYERWVPEYCKEAAYEYPWKPQPYMRYCREVLSYGLRLTSGGIIWTNPVQFNNHFVNSTFNWLPYEESFRAERFERMRITFD